MTGKKILIVEDDYIIAMDFSTILEDMGYMVCGMAHDGKEAIEMARSFSPDVILMDINLGPGMDGIEAAIAIRKVANIPVIFCSGHVAGETLIRAKLSNPDGFVRKPYDECEIVRAIETCLLRDKPDPEVRGSPPIGQ